MRIIDGKLVDAGGNVVPPAGGARQPPPPPPPPPPPRRLELQIATVGPRGRASVDLGPRGVWPVELLAWASDVHVRIRYIHWDSWDPTGEDETVVHASTLLPLPDAPAPALGRMTGAVGLLDGFSSSSPTARVLRRVKVVEELGDGGLRVRVLPRTANGTVDVPAGDVAHVRWSPGVFDNRTRDKRYDCTPVRQLPAAAPARHPLTVAASLANWEQDPSSVKSQLSALATPTDYVSLRDAAALHAEAEWIARLGDDAARSTPGENGGMRSLGGTDRGHSLWNPVMCQVMLERINPPPGGVQLDAMGGGNQRGLMYAWAGGDAISNDVRPAVAEEGRQQLKRLPPGSGHIEFITGDARNLVRITLALSTLLC